MINDLEKRLKELIISSGEDININDINESTDLAKDFNFSSINIIQLVINIESAFSIEIDDNNLMFEKLTPYISLFNIVIEKLNNEQMLKGDFNECI